MTVRKLLRSTDVITGTVLALAGLIMLLFVIPSQIETGNEYGLSDSFVPNLFMGALTALGAMLTVKGIIGQKYPDGVEFNTATLRHLALVALLLLTTLGLMALGGFLVGGIFVIAAFMIYQGERRPVAIAITAVAGAGLIYLFFRHGLSILLI